MASGDHCQLMIMATSATLTENFPFWTPFLGWEDFPGLRICLFSAFCNEETISRPLECVAAFLSIGAFFSGYLNFFVWGIAKCQTWAPPKGTFSAPAE